MRQPANLRKWVWLCLVAGVIFWGGRSLHQVDPQQVGLSAVQLNQLETVIKAAIQAKDIPGAVICVGRKGKIVYWRAYGWSQLLPVKKKMSRGMIFDLASLTKPIATATSIMILVERGQIRLRDKVKQFVPSFRAYQGKEGEEKDALIWHLLTHTSGLPPYAQVEEIQKSFGRPCQLEQMVNYIAHLEKLSPPGKTFRYSCLGFITLAYIVEKVSGEKFDVFARRHIFQPLGMTKTFFNPPEEMKSSCVPTEKLPDGILQGIVHDPLARLLGGVSGNAGLFSSAEDLALFAQMMLNQGQLEGVRILSPLSIRRMTEVFPLASFAGRGLGWDLSSAYASPRGDLFGPRSYGHTGYTGTSLWIDPETQTFIILLTNRVHPEDKGSVTSLRTRVANIVAAAVLE
jgi:CubicO group peptidase (beta-lactamase class C family)